MSKKSKKSSKNFTLHDVIVLATATLKLIEVIIELLKNFKE